MDFHNKHLLESTVNQLQPQRLSNNVWLGPLNSVAQSEFLSQNNIKYIFGIMASQKCAYYLKDLSPKQFCCVSIDPHFNIQKLTEDEGECLMRFNTQFTPAVSTISGNTITNAVITSLDFQKMLEDFLLLVHAIQHSDPSGGILLFSLNGNDNLLSTFALSYIQDAHNCDVAQSYSYLKSIRPSVKEFDEYGFFANEVAKFHLNHKARKQFDTSVSPMRTKRGACDVTDHEEAERRSPRVLKRTAQ
ncbi:uncharacterized protein CYBJADRAFT_168297 [Cyberlindnera jadinii NRRL Y-1542]|uniref:Uncharacterized protein n=1 Tax=Cyberlindnera jadinii (strain ATCC 18201 / CBS 1600 / BCRC 20928 / JCM 3617 / NBRC 0987 / NRRL Y-1542) TaxID=983966 RepID=A0A1E4RZT8_CYBJN|nr:hypothetical protein CYBJADRAFT_168297 [Cyberlindnera jadinii NRRL Y-1542]ODV72761.1 hypothetical protein CYBJADRAFT_168297 [Cyberlindnera jadinii NRRL Y-1542]